jgi:hypothetical protein
LAKADSSSLLEGHFRPLMISLPSTAEAQSYRTANHFFLTSL